MRKKWTDIGCFLCQDGHSLVQHLVGKRTHDHMWMLCRVTGINMVV